MPPRPSALTMRYREASTVPRTRRCALRKAGGVCPEKAAVGRSQTVGASLADGAPQAGQIVVPSGTSAEQPAQTSMVPISVTGEAGLPVDAIAQHLLPFEIRTALQPFA